MEKVKRPINVGQALLKALKWFFSSFIWLGLILLALDIVSKVLIFFFLEDNISIIPGFLNITLVLNPNAAFGLGFSDPVLNRVMYIIVYLIGLAILTGIYIVKYRKLSKLLRACLIMMAAGALGNLLDRMFYSFSGYQVIDWINFYGIWEFVFNVADSSVVVGTIMLIIWLIVSEVKDFKAKKALIADEGKVLSADEKARIEEVIPDDDAADNVDDDIVK
ncbi:MAG TPA: signal peptidase II [Bacilli bacterium]|nr:signal peptidase II [Bacilli bacterium]